MKAERLVKAVREGLYQLAALYLVARHGPVHGYELREMMAKLLGVEPSESTVYDTLRRLEKAGLVESFWVRSRFGPPRRCYRIRPGADRVLLEAVRELTRVAQALAEGVEELARGAGAGAPPSC